VSDKNKKAEPTAKPVGIEKRGVEVGTVAQVVSAAATVYTATQSGKDSGDKSGEDSGAKEE
jgi:hypothetical protein